MEMNKIEWNLINRLRHRRRIDGVDVGVFYDGRQRS